MLCFQILEDNSTCISLPVCTPAACFSCQHPCTFCTYSAEALWTLGSASLASPELLPCVLCATALLDNLQILKPYPTSSEEMASVCSDCSTPPAAGHVRQGLHSHDGRTDGKRQNIHNNQLHATCPAADLPSCAFQPGECWRCCCCCCRIPPVRHAWVQLCKEPSASSAHCALRFLSTSADSVLVKWSATCSMYHAIAAMVEAFLSPLYRKS